MGRTPKTETETIAFDFNKSNQKLRWPDFVRFCAEYPNSAGSATYVYRLEPRINRAQAGIFTKNIDVAAEALTEDFVFATYGSGTYYLKFTDSNRPRGLHEVATCTAELWNPSIDPIIDPRELDLSEPKNGKWKAKYLSAGFTVEDVEIPIKKGSEQMIKIQRLAPPGTNADTAAASVERMAEKMVEQDKQASSSRDDLLRDLVRQVTSARAGDPDSLDRAFKIAERLQPKADPAMQTLIGKLADLALSGRESAAPARNHLQELRETAAFLKEMGFGGRSEPAAPDTSWIAAVVPFLPSLVGIVRQLLVVPAAGPQPGRVVDVQPQQTAPAAVPAEQNPNGGDMFGMPNLNAFVEVGQDALDAFDRGLSGAEFAHGLCCRRGGEALYEGLAKLGKTMLLQMVNGAAGSVPGLAEKLAQHKRALETFIEEFLQYGEEEQPTSASNTGTTA
jgi:hypothetical protein